MFLRKPLRNQFLFVFTHWHSSSLSDSSVFVWSFFGLTLFISALEEHCLLQFKLDISCPAIPIQEKCSSFPMRSLHSHISKPLFSISLLHLFTPSLFPTLLSSSPPALASCYLSKSVLHFWIHQMFSIQQLPGSRSIGCRTLKLLISPLASLDNLKVSAMKEMSAFCNSLLKLKISSEIKLIIHRDQTCVISYNDTWSEVDKKKKSRNVFWLYRANSRTLSPLFYFQ